jgi:23S rRNA-/tRNA-specific pseudouridylate synthase
MTSLGHAVVGDVLYGAPREIRGDESRKKLKRPDADALSLSRNFLHSAELVLQHPRTGTKIALTSPLPLELESFLAKLDGKP